MFNTGDISPDHGEHYARDFYPVIQKLTERVPFFPVAGQPRCSVGQSRQSAPFLCLLLGRPLTACPGRPTMNICWIRQIRSSGTAYCMKMFCLLCWIPIFSLTRAATGELTDFKLTENHLAEQMNWVKNLLEKSSSRPEIRAKFVFFTTHLSSAGKRSQCLCGAGIRGIGEWW